MFYKYFSNVSTLDELKAAYRRLVLQHHPDRGGDPEVMKAINNEHDSLFEELKRNHNKNADQYHQTTETAEEFRQIINELMKIGDDIVIELCGSWLWISGDTKPHKDELKNAGCMWAAKKGMWYWRHPEKRSSSRGNHSMQYIRDKFGSQVIDHDGRETRTAGKPQLSYT